MQTKTTDIEELEARVEERAHEVEEAEANLHACQASIARAEQTLAHLEDERKKLAPRVYSNDEAASIELSKVEDQHDEAERVKRGAVAAKPELTRLLENAREWLVEARGAVHRSRANELRQQVESLNSERDHHADALLEVLNRQKSLEGKLTQTLNNFDQTTANARASDREGPQRRWVKKKFRDWL
jgi:chromosome segregation ATPase